MGQSIQLGIYVNYPGHCEAAFQFYEEHRGGTITLMNYHQAAPDNFPQEWEHLVLHDGNRGCLSEGC